MFAQLFCFFFVLADGRCTVYVCMSCCGYLFTYNFYVGEWLSSACVCVCVRYVSVCVCVCVCVCV